MSTSEVIRLEGGHWRDLRVKTYNEPVGVVAPAVMRRVRTFGHKVEPQGGTYTLDGECRELNYRVTVTLDGRDWTWLHSFVTPEAITTPTTADQEADA